MVLDDCGLSVGFVVVIKQWERWTGLFGMWLWLRMPLGSCRHKNREHFFHEPGSGACLRRVCACLLCTMTEIEETGIFQGGFPVGLLSAGFFSFSDVGARWFERYPGTGLIGAGQGEASGIKG